MNIRDDKQTTNPGKHRRWLLGLEPIFEGGWLHKGKRGQTWDVEAELIAVALFGDVTIDLARAHSVHAETVVNAWAIFRDVDVTVAAGDDVELNGGSLFGDLNNEVPRLSEDHRGPVIRIHGHTLLGDVTARLADDHS